MCIFAMDMWSNCMWMRPTLWVAEWSLIVQGRPKNTIYQDDETYVNMIPKLRIKCHSISRGFNLCLPAEGAYFISTVAQTGHAFSWHEKSSNCVHIIMKMAVKPVYTIMQKKIYPVAHYIEYLILTLPTRQCYYFATILKHIMPSQIWSKHCTSNDL